MSILESMKSERKLSFSHWRYRLLHWAFNVKNPDPKNPTATGLPLFLYSHYCPLFHLTNLIAFFSPFILIGKIIWLVFNALMVAMEVIPFDKISAFFKGFFPSKEICHSECCEVKKETFSRKKFLYALKDWHEDFEAFWCCRGSKFGIISKADAELLFNEFMPKIVQARKEARIRKEKWRQRIIFWTNFSQGFIKWTLNIAYVALGLFLLYTAYAIAVPAWELICWCCEGVCWMFSDLVTLGFLWFLIKVVFWVGLIVMFVVGLFKLGFVQRFLKTIGNGFRYISPPFFLLLLPFKWIRNGFVNTAEFIAMFYEENCPPITIVSEEEGVIDSIAHNEEVI